MRADFYSVLTDGNANRYPDAKWTRVAIRDDDDPTPLGHARDFSKGWREGRNFRYSLVKRYLRSQVGRPFDDVTSDIARTLGGAADGIDRVMRVVEGCVDNPRIAEPRGRVAVALGIHRRCPLYVDEAGILRAGPGLGRHARNAAIRRALAPLTDPFHVPITADRPAARHHASLDCVDGSWFLSRWERHEGARLGVAVMYLTVYGYRTPFQDGPVTRRQVSSRDIRRLGLAAWSADAESLGASIAGRDYDRDAEERQARRLKAAPRLIGIPSNRRG